MEDTSPAPALEPTNYTCPHCGQELEAIPDAQAAQMLTCPHCGQPFVVAAQDGSTELPEEQEHKEHELRREDELSALKIHQVVRSRRAAIRARSYCLIGVWGAIVIAVDLIWKAIGKYRWEHRTWLASSYLVSALIFLMAALHFAAEAHRFAREIAAAGVPDPVEPPDLSTLSDGSQAVKNLERLQ